MNFTKDHKLVLLHDNNLKRLLGIDKDINDLNWENIENLNIRHEDKISSNNVLTLEDLLQEDYAFQTVYLDFKTTSNVNGLNDNFSVSSRNFDLNADGLNEKVFLPDSDIGIMFYASSSIEEGSALSMKDNIFSENYFVKL